MILTKWKQFYRILETDFGWKRVDYKGTPSITGKYYKSPTRNVAISCGALMTMVISISNISYCKLPTLYGCQIQIDIQNKLIYFCDIGDINVKYIAMDAS